MTAKPGKTVAVFTSGGDSCGMNPAVRAVVRTALNLGSRVFIIRKGYKGMINDTNGKYIQEANWNSVCGILNKGGTDILSARSPEFKTKEGRLKAAANLVKNGICNLVCIGGDGSLTGVNLFSQEWPSLLEELVNTNVITKEQQQSCSHLKIVGLVGSIDNDFCGTDMTIGADTALFRILEEIDNILTTASSHERIFILEVMGRHCGYLALVAAVACESSTVFIPESPPEDGWQDKLIAKLKADKANKFNFILVAEGAKDRQGNKITIDMIKKVLDDKGGLHDVRVTVIGHKQRGGIPSAFDRILGSREGHEAVKVLLEDDPESTNYVISLDGNKVVREPLMACVERTQEVTKAMAEGRFDDAVQLRGRSFQRNLGLYQKLCDISPSTNNAFRCGIICIGPPSCGMNSAIRAFVRRVISRGGQVLAFINGIDGLSEGKVRELQWQDVNGWTFEAGTRIGTRRTILSDPVVLEKVSQQLEKNKIQGLAIIGGFEAYHCSLQMFKARSTYYSLRIPVAVIPATMSNNVPGTDYSLGCDTTLNELIKDSDRLMKSAEATGRRVFVMETMGGHCGYLATMAGLAGGAEQAYICEEKLDLKKLIKDINEMDKKMEGPVTRGLIMRNEKTDYSTDLIVDLFGKEGKSFTTKKHVSGYTQQGGNPSPFDRKLGATMGVMACDWIVDDMLKIDSGKPATDFLDKESIVLIGLVKKGYEKTPVYDLKADFNRRMPTEAQGFLELRPLLRILSMPNYDDKVDRKE